MADAGSLPQPASGEAVASLLRHRDVGSTPHSVVTVCSTLLLFWCTAAAGGGDAASPTVGTPSRKRKQPDDAGHGAAAARDVVPQLTAFPDDMLPALAKLIEESASGSVSAVATAFVKDRPQLSARLVRCSLMPRGG